MTTLIAVYNSEGCVGRCDAKCYDATGDSCQCICGGANHGAGLSKARDNVREYAETMIQENGHLYPDAVRFDITPDTPAQLPLFDLKGLK